MHLEVNLILCPCYGPLFPAIRFKISAFSTHSTRTEPSLQRITVILGGILIFGLWMSYRTGQNIWPLQLLMLACVGVVPLRYAPADCILKVLKLSCCLIFTGLRGSSLRFSPIVLTTKPGVPRQLNFGCGCRDLHLLINN